MDIEGISREITEPEEERKLFVGGLKSTSTEKHLYEAFLKYGTLMDVCTIREPRTFKPRGFGFVTFSKSAMMYAVLAACPDNRIMVDGKMVEIKRITITEPIKPGKPNDALADPNTTRVFLGGIPETTDEQSLIEFFSKFGPIESVELLQKGKKPRSFGFVTFKSKDSVERVVSIKHHYFNGKKIEAKRAIDKEKLKKDPPSELATEFSKQKGKGGGEQEEKKEGGGKKKKAGRRNRKRDKKDGDGGSDGQQGGQGGQSQRNQGQDHQRGNVGMNKGGNMRMDQGGPRGMNSGANVGPNAGPNTGSGFRMGMGMGTDGPRGFGSGFDRMNPNSRMGPDMQMGGRGPMGQGGQMQPGAGSMMKEFGNMDKWDDRMFENMANMPNMPNMPSMEAMKRQFGEGGPPGDFGGGNFPPMGGRGFPSMDFPGGGGSSSQEQGSEKMKEYYKYMYMMKYKWYQMMKAWKAAKEGGGSAGTGGSAAPTSQAGYGSTEGQWGSYGNMGSNYGNSPSGFGPVKDNPYQGGGMGPYGGM